MKITRADVPLILIKVGLGALLVSWILYALAGCTLYSDGHVSGAYDQKSINAELTRAEHAQKDPVEIHQWLLDEAFRSKKEYTVYHTLMHGADSK